MKKLLLALTVSFITSASLPTFAFTEAEKAEKLLLIKQIKSEGGTVYAMLPKNVVGPFFKIAEKGCLDAAKALGVHCIYYGSTYGNMRLQQEDILALIATEVDGIAVSGVRKGFLAETVGDELRAWGKPIISYDSPLSTEISLAYIGTNNYLLGRALGIEVRKLRPQGGTFCIQAERPDSPNHQVRVGGIMDGLTKDGTDADGWKSLSGCPLHQMGDYERATAQMLRTIGRYNVEVFISTGGGSQFLPALYRETMAPFKDKIKMGKLLFANVDTLPAQLQHLREGISTVNVGQRPYEMGWWAIKVLKLITDEEAYPMVINTGLTFCTKETVETCTNALERIPEKERP